MVKFTPLLPQDAAALFHNRFVCDVIENRLTTLPEPIVSWRGSVAEEYFSVMFLRGILTVSLSERECQLGYNAVNYAMSEALSQALSVAGDNSIMTTEAHFNYNTNRGIKEQKEISFTDVMVVLGWQYKDESVKVDYNPLT